MAMVTKGTNIAFGDIAKGKEILVPEEAIAVKVRARPESFTEAIVRYPDGVERWYIQEHEDCYTLAVLQSSNRTQKGEGRTSTLDQVKLFHEVFGHPVKSQPDISDEDLNEARVKFLREEVVELEEALEAGDMVEVLDALTDIQYFLDGSYHCFGMAHLKTAAFEEVQRSNMSKLGPDGKAIYRADGKIVKGPNFSPPNLAPLFEADDNNV